MESCDFFVELLGEQNHLIFELALLFVEFELGEHLVGERCAHHEARVSGCTTQVEQATFGQDQDAVAVREDPFVVLRFDVDVLDTLDLLEASHVDLVVEVSNVAHDGLVLHLRHVVGGDEVEVARGGDEDVRGRNDFFECRDLEAFHRGLQRTDRIDLGHDHAAALARECLCGAAPDLAVTQYDGNLAAEHHVTGAHQAVGQ